MASSMDESYRLLADLGAAFYSNLEKLPDLIRRIEESVAMGKLLQETRCDALLE